MTPEKDNILQYKRLSSDSEYFTNVFKRTEKVVSVIFYILSHIEDKKDTEYVRSLVKDKALQTHETSLATLRLLPHQVRDGVLNLQYSLQALESTLRIAEAAGVITTNIALLLFEQLLTIQRYVSNNYQKEPSVNFIENLFQVEPKGRELGRGKTTVATVATPRKRAVNIPTHDISSDAYLVYSQLSDRTERIKTVLEAKPQATIKDISEIITDVSEKTIQRELNSLIEKGQVIREGERRWSKYSVKK